MGAPFPHEALDSHTGTAKSPLHGMARCDMMVTLRRNAMVQCRKLKETKMPLSVSYAIYRSGSAKPITLPPLPRTPEASAIMARH